MALTSPATQSSTGAALRPKGVYIPSLTTTYVVWTVSSYGKHKFVLKEHAGPALTDIYLNVVPGYVADFDITESPTAGQVTVAYTDRNDLYYFEFSVPTGTIVTPITKFVHDAAVPGVGGSSGSGYTNFFYVAARNFQSRKLLRQQIPDPFSIGETIVLQQESKDIRDMDSSSSSTAYIENYAGTHGNNVEVARHFSTDSFEIVLYDHTAAQLNGLIIDQSGNDLHATPSSDTYHSTDGLYFRRQSTCTIPTWQMPATFTIEVMFRYEEDREVVLFDDPATIKMWVNASGDLRFTFQGATYEHKLSQTRLGGAVPGILNYVAVSHEWGDGSKAKIVVNGVEVETSWFSLDASPGDENPGYTNINLVQTMADRNTLVGLYISSRIKLTSDMLNFVLGRV